MSGSIERRVRELVEKVARGYGLHLTPTVYGFDTGSGDRINIANVIAECRRTEQGRWPTIVFEFVAKIVGAPTAESARKLSDHEFVARARARILPHRYFEQAGGAASASYCRKLLRDNTDGTSPLIALSLDYPETVTTLTDPDLAGRDVAAVWAAAIAATGAEGDYVRETVGVNHGHEGVDVLHGDSLYVASKVLDHQRLLDELGPAPHGFVFAIPNSYTLAVHRLQSSAAVLAIREMIRFAVKMAAEGPALTHELFYWRAGGIQRITRTVASKVAVEVEGDFARAVHSLPERN